MKTYSVPVLYQMYGHVTVQADSIDEAILEADGAPLPVNATYIEDSFEVVDVGDIEEI